MESIIEKGEGRSVEFKEEMNESAYKTIAGFANGDGGVLLSGVNDKGEVIGTDTSNKNIEKITNRIFNNIKITPLIDVFEVKNKKILYIEVKKSTFPVTYNDTYYIRVGSSTRKLEGENLLNFLLKYKKQYSWDEIPGNYSLDEIDEETLDYFIQLGINNGRLKNIDLKNDLESKLSQLGLCSKEGITNGAILLFGKDPQKHFPNALIRIAKLADETNIINDREIKGNLFKQIDVFQEEIKNNLNVKYLIPKDNFYRKDYWEYPLDSVREAILNAIIHRDYFKNNVSTQVKIYKNCIYIYNIGGLPEGITMNQLKETHSSVARNPLIVGIIYRSGIIEQLGTGIKRMRDSLKNAGHPDLDFREESYSFTTCLWGKFSKKNFIEKDLNPRQIKAIEFAFKKGSITQSEYGKIYPDSSKSTLRTDLNDLVEKNLLIPKGETKGRVYNFNYSNGTTK